MRSRPLLVSSLVLVLLSAFAPAAGTDPKILGETPGGVRILRGGPKPGATPASAIDLVAPAPAAGDSLARAVARSMVDAFGGPLSLQLWSERGELRGRQWVLGPTKAEARVRERRAGTRQRVDIALAGTRIAFGLGPDGAW